MKLSPVILYRLDFILLLLCLPILTFAQSGQTISGRVVDAETQQPLIGAAVFVFLEDSTQHGAVANEFGEFSIAGVPLGRQTVYCSYFGYQTYASDYLEVTSAKEVIMTIEMKESWVNMEQVVVSADRNEGQRFSEFNLVSMRSFEAEATQRYAGSLNDVGRMAMSLPAVQFSQQDNENTIVVRANSPMGLLWRLEDTDITNPNHFADRFSSGGGISALSINVLGGSEFSAGAFAPQYGNAVAGVMDLKFRKGNTTNQERRIQVGLIGLDASIEGPIKQGQSSYLANYRYSTLGILDKMGIRVVQPNVGNVFQDGAFNIYQRVGNNAFINVFGFGALSNEVRDHVEDQTDWEFYKDSWQYTFDTYNGAIGLSWTQLLENDAFFKTVISTSGTRVEWNQTWHDPAFYHTINEEYLDGRINLSLKYQRKLRKGLTISGGAQVSRRKFNVLYNQSNLPDDQIVSSQGSAFTLQPYLQVQQTFSEQLTMTYGLHSLWYSRNNEITLEPRLALRYQPSSAYAATLGLGKHSQLLPFGVTESNLSGTEPDLPKAYHVIFANEFYLGSMMTVKVEPYYQYLYDVAASKDPQSSYWAFNQEDRLEYHDMASTGTGENIGVDLSFEKAFSNHLFFLLSGSFYSSTFQTNNGGFSDKFDSRYNSNFNSSLMAGKEWSLTNDRAFEFTMRFLASGGLRYTPIDEAASAASGTTVYYEDRAYEEQTRPYHRLDVRAAYRKNKEKVSWKLSLDIQNAYNQLNYKRPFYDAWLNEIHFEEQSGLVPVISYTLDF